MVYPIIQINELLQDMDKALWYCSLDMDSICLVVQVTERSRQLKAFITPSRLFEWLRMPFGMKITSHVYQRMIYNALYGYHEIKARSDEITTGSRKVYYVFTEGEPDPDPRPSVVDFRSNIDVILITAESWFSFSDKVERQLEVCDY